MGICATPDTSNVAEPAEVKISNGSTPSLSRDRTSQLNISALAEPPEEKDPPEGPPMTRDTAARVIQRRFRGVKARQKCVRVLVCHCCGRKFGVSQLRAHVEICLRDHRRPAKIVPRVVRSPKPRPPNASFPSIGERDQNAFRMYNEEAYGIFRQSQSRCPTCRTRNFEPSTTGSSFLEHLKLCCAEGRSTPLNFQDYGRTLLQRVVRGDAYRRLAVCYSCGEEIPTDLYNDHVPDCLEMRERIVAERIPDRSLRPRAPLPPVGFQHPIPSPRRPSRMSPEDEFEAGDSFRMKQQERMIQLQKFNLAAREAYRSSLPHCPGCHGRFMLVDLMPHVDCCEKVL